MFSTLRRNISRSKSLRHIVPAALTYNIARRHVPQLITTARYCECPPSIKLKIIPAEEPTKLSYDERNMRKNRALSPHLSIYRPQITSVMSILLRGTGLALAVIVWTIGLVGLIQTHDIEDYVNCCLDLKFGKYTLTALKALLVLPFAYHVCNGTRHLIWHTGLFLSKPLIYFTGYLTIVLTLLLTGYLATLPCEDDGGKAEFNREHIEKTLSDMKIDVEENAENVSLSDAIKALEEHKQVGKNDRHFAKTEENDERVDKVEERVDNEDVVARIRRTQDNIQKQKDDYDGDDD